MKKINYKNILLITIISLGFFLRIFRISYSPPSLNWDEAAIGYNAYSILKTGKDEYGYRLPLSFRSFDDFKPPLYSYLTTIPILLFGLNELSVRLLAVFSGTLSIFLIFLIGKKMFNRNVGLLSAIFMAIQPWSIHFSRVAFEATAALPITLAGIYFLLEARSKNSFRLVLLSLISTILGAYAYYANRALFIPSIVIILFFARKIIKGKKQVYKTIITIIIFSLPIIWLMMAGGGLERFHNTSIFSILENYDGSYLSLSQNKLFYLVKSIFARYLSYFSPANLFVRGTPEPIQRIHGFSVFFPLQFIFLLVGGYYLIKNAKKYSIFIIFLLLMPTPASITWNWFSTVRVLPLFALLTIIMGLGVEKLYLLISKRSKVLSTITFASISVILLNSLAVLLTTLFLYTPYAEKGDWQFGFREIMNEIKPYYEDYDQVILETGHAQPHIFTLFYLQYDPARYHESIQCPDCVPIPRLNWDFGNIRFRKIYWPDDRNLKNTLFIGNEYNLPTSDVQSQEGAVIIKEIYDTHGSFVARVVTTGD